jgi:peptide/nickel transport system substrate-binding protein
MTLPEERTTRRTSTRREFIVRSIGGLTVAGVGVLAAACQPAAPAGPAPGSAPTAAGGASTSATSPRRGGTLTWGVWDKFDDIDPATVTGAAALEVINNVLDPLVAMDEDQKFYPALATRWTVEEDAKRFTFTLRDDVTFHDGTVLDSTAVKRTWERILDPATKAAGVVPLFGPISKIEAPDPRTVVVSLSESYPPFLLQIWRPYFGILSPRYLDTLKPGDKITAPIGSGPFKFAGRSADGVVTLDANPDYAWGSEILKNRRAPYLQTLKFRAITESSTRVATLESGESLLIDELSEPDYARLKSDKRFAFVEAPRRSHTLGFYFNITRPPTDDLAVRQAINWAVDRRSIVDRVFFGVHKVSIGPLSEGVWARSDEPEKRFAYDPARAQQLLDGAGWKLGSDGIRVKDGQRLQALLATFRSPWTELAEAMQAQLRAVGIDLQVQKMDRGPYLDFVRVYNHNLCATASTSVDPDGIVRVAYHSSNRARTNFANLSDPALDAMLDMGAQQAIGSAERKATYEDIQKKIMDLAPFVGVMSQVRIEASAAKVHDLHMGPDGLNATQMNDVWIDA